MTHSRVRNHGSSVAGRHGQRILAVRSRPASRSAAGPHLWARGRARALVVVVVLTPLLALPALASDGSASPAAFADYNGTLSATGVHVVSGSSAFPNFATGAVDSHLPLATVRLDSSPDTQAISSPADTGPAGQTFASQAHVSQPQYADVRCPPTCGEPVSVGAPPGPSATSAATTTSASATARAAGTQPPAPAPGVDASPGSGRDVTPADFPTETLRSSLAAWRHRWLNAADARAHPMPGGQAALSSGTAPGTTDTDGAGGDTADATGRFADGALTLTGDGAVGRLTLGGGMVELRGVAVHVRLTNDGDPQRQVTVTVGAASVGGVPVSIGSDGVSVAGQALPGLGDAAGPAAAALNSALAAAGIELRSLAPAATTAGHRQTLEVVGVLIRLAPASPAPGVPTSFTTIAVAEVSADSNATPADAPVPPEATAGAGGAVPGASDGSGPPAASSGARAAPAPLPPPAGPAAGEPAAAASPGGPSTASGPDAGAVGSGPPRPVPSAAAPDAGAGAGDASGSAPGPSAAGARGPARRTLSAAPIARLGRRHKPLELVLLYLIWQSLVIGAVASLWLWCRGPASP